jgi:hypothetical protein
MNLAISMLQANSAAVAARMNSNHLMVEEIIRKSCERNSENIDRVLRQTNRSS